jgi:hypothetical protein
MDATDTIQTILEFIQSLGWVGGMALVRFVTGARAARYIRTIRTAAPYGMAAAVAIYGYLYFV